jgi:hypothetical protein
VIDHVSLFAADGDAMEAIQERPAGRGALSWETFGAHGGVMVLRFEEPDDRRLEGASCR